MIRSNYILKLLEKDERLDGRKLDEYRPIVVEKKIIGKAEGSARVKLGKTDVIVGIKTEIETPFPDTPNEGVLKTNAEFAPIAHEEFLPGPPGEDATELARVVDRGIRESKCIELEKLCITEGEKVWGIYVDIHVINHDGNLIDASALGAMAALLNTKIPKYEDNKIIRNEFQMDLPVVHKPVTVTVGKVIDKFLLDADQEEEQVLDAWLSIATREDGVVCAMQKGGKSGLKQKDVDDMIVLAMKKSKELRKKL